MRFIFWAMGLFSLVGIVVSSKKAVAGNVPSVSIIGGTPAALGEFPYLAALNLDGRICSGSLISTTHVLTASTCLDSSQSFASKYTVYLNTLKYDGTTSGAITRKVKKFILHPADNLGVLVLSAAVTTIKPIPLPPSIPLPTKPTTKKPASTTTIPTTIATPSYGCTCIPITPAPIPSGYANMNSVIAGWGLTNQSAGLNSKVLLKANVTIQDDSVCTRQYGSDFDVGRELCASAPGKDTCGTGDHGGPVIVKGVLVGTTDWGYGCADPNYAGVYTRITTYVDWIKTTMANNVG